MPSIYMAPVVRSWHTVEMAIASMLGDLLIELFCYVAILGWVGTVWFSVLLDLIIPPSACTAAPPSS